MHWLYTFCLILTIWTTFMSGYTSEDRNRNVLPYDCDSGEKPPFPLLKHMCKYSKEFQSLKNDPNGGLFNPLTDITGKASPDVTNPVLRALMLNSTDPDELMYAFVKHMRPVRLGPLTGLASMLVSTRMPGRDPWVSNKALVEGAGHQWCAIARDNWACKGEQYVSVLKATAPYDDKLGLAAFPENTFIYAEGNSYIGEVLFSTICNSPNIDVWKPYHGGGNDVFVHEPTKNVTLLLIDNDTFFNIHTEAVIKMLRYGNMKPDLIVLGLLNYGSAMHMRQTNGRKRTYEATFPHVPVVELPVVFRSHVTMEEYLNGSLLDHVLPGSCEQSFKDNSCTPGHGQHQCFPGPLLRPAERIMQGLLRVLAGRGK